MRALATSMVLALLAMTSVQEVGAQEFTYNPPGDLFPNSGEGRADETVYVPGMRYPIEETPSYANSQVWFHGGSRGPGGGQCDPANYSYPWWDNFCESRGWEMPLCPVGTGHQGQDIRPSTCDDKTHWAVAAEDGTITNIGSYSVYLMSEGGTLHRYLHMDPASVAVRNGDRVTKGQRLGLISNAFGGTPTTIHLHYDLNQNIEGVGNAYVPTYMSLVRSYEELLGSPGQSCPEIPPSGLILDNTARCFSLFGDPEYWRHVTDAGMEGDLYWTHGWVNETPGNWARWRLSFVEAGSYELAVNALEEYARSRETIYTIAHSGEEVTVTVDQSAGVAEGWAVVGTFDFPAGEVSVSVLDNTGEDVALERRIMVDGLRLTRIDGPDPSPDPIPDAGVEPDVAPSPDPEPAAAPDMAPAMAPVPEPVATEPEAPAGPAINETTFEEGCSCRTTSGAAPTGGAHWLALALSLLACRRRDPRDT